MDHDDLPSRPHDRLADLAREDLDRLSVAELQSRIAGLEAEVARCRKQIDGALGHRASADALFRR